MTIRILWADDQHQVASTLSRVLTQPVDIEYVTDGESALGRLLSGGFDLAIVDLAMPPGDWGGLWLIEQLATARCDVPVVVLSGEGSQAETIAAMRLGADYVRKEDAAQELAGRVTGAVNQHRESRDHRIEDDAPAPVAVPYRRIRSAESDIERLRRAVSAIEAALRYRAYLGLSMATNTGAEHSVQEQSIRAPSLGAWSQIARSVDNVLVSEELLPSPDWKRLQRVVELRNDLHHGIGLSHDATVRHLDWVIPVAADLASVCVSHILAFPRSLTFDSTSFSVDCLRLNGHSPAFEVTRLERQEPLETGVVHLLVGERSIRLDPWIRITPGETAPTWTLLVFESIQWDGRSPLQRGTILRYLDIWTGERNVTAGATVEDLRLFDL